MTQKPNSVERHAQLLHKRGNLTLLEAREIVQLAKQIGERVAQLFSPGDDPIDEPSPDFDKSTPIESD